MHLERDDIAGAIRIKSYTKGCLTINDVEIKHSVIVTPHQWQAWAPTHLAEVTHADFEPLYPLKPEVVLFGVGAQFTIPPVSLLAPLYEHKIPIEIMDTASACRTLMLLAADKRHVVACLLIV
jgi:uncharacterized protein